VLEKTNNVLKKKMVMAGFSTAEAHGQTAGHAARVSKQAHLLPH
jgi:hypothetical protein